MSTGNSPAFPCQDNKKQIYTGMNLRDYFALETLHAIITKDGVSYDLEGWCDTKLASKCYSIADAMLDERQEWK